jgi:hypothetical protein
MKKFTPVLLLIALLAGFVVTSAQDYTPCAFDPGRVNTLPHRDCGAPVAIYVNSTTITVLAPDPGIGPEQFVLSVPWNDDIPADANKILVQTTNPVNGRPAILSRLTTGEWQLNTFHDDGAPYVVVWYLGPDLYHLDPVTGQPLDGATSIIAPGATNPSAGSSAPPPAVIVETGATSTGSASGTVTTEGPMISMPAADAVPLSNCRVTTTRIVRMRTEPNTNSAIMARLPYRTSWTATERTADWFRVIYQNTQGWVSAQFLSTVGSCDLQ